jgi:hypothetical protein
MYQSWARDMYYWKTISRVKKYHAPHVLRGVLVREEAQLETMPVESLPPAQIPPDLARTFEVPIEGVDRLKQTILAHPGWGDPHAQITKEQISGEISVSPPAAAEPATAPATEPAQAPATEEAAQESFFPPPAPATEDQKPPRKRTKE